MGISRQQDILVGSDINSTLNAVRTAISQCRWKLAKVKQNVIVAATGMSLTSYGETITITFQVVNNGVQLNIQSKSGWALVDWGNNNNNIRKFIKNLSNMLPIYAI